MERKEEFKVEEREEIRENMWQKGHANSPIHSGGSISDGGSTKDSRIKP